MTQNRRSFLRFLGLAPVVAVAPALPTRPEVVFNHPPIFTRLPANDAQALIQFSVNHFRSQTLRIVNMAAKGGIIANAD